MAGETQSLCPHPSRHFILQKTLDLCVPASRWQGEQTVKKFLIKFLMKGFVARELMETETEKGRGKRRKEVQPWEGL